MSNINQEMLMKIKSILDNTDEVVKQKFSNYSEKEIEEIINQCKSTVIEILSVVQPSLNQLTKVVSEQSIFTIELEEKVERFKQNFHDLTFIKEGDIVRDPLHHKGRVEKIIPGEIVEDEIIYYGNKRALKRKELRKVTEHQEIIDYIVTN